VRVRLILAVALGLVALTVGMTLSGSPVVAVHTNSVLAEGKIAETVSNAAACQAGEVLPKDISAIRLTLFSTAGPAVGVRALSGTRVLTRGAVGSGWTGGSVTVPVAPVRHATSGVRICFNLGTTKEKVVMVGSPTPRAIAARSSEGQALSGRIKIEYLRAGRRSWWALAQTVARRMGLGRAPNGTWIALLVIALMGTAVALTAWLTVKELS
jgi:hypothetical protein